MKSVNFHLRPSGPRPSGPAPLAYVPWLHLNENSQISQPHILFSHRFTWIGQVLSLQTSLRPRASEDKPSLGITSLLLRRISSGWIGIPPCHATQCPAWMSRTFEDISPKRLPWVAVSSTSWVSQMEKRRWETRFKIVSKRTGPLS